jgi:predicted lipoprotein
MTLRTAAAAVLARWDSPQWEWRQHGPTADLMADLRAAIDEALKVATPTAGE